MFSSVFISYSTADTAVAEQIRDGLEAASISCWMAPRDIAPGQDYAEQIIHAIEACAVLVLVFSESSNRSIYVLKEVERAIAKRKVVIPFRVHNVTPSRSLEFLISNCQWVDASQSSLLAPLATLTAAIHNYLHAPAGEAPEQIRSGEPISSEQPRALESPRAVPPFQVLTPPAHFVGRSAEIAQLKHGLTQAGAPLYALVGMGGAGKTTLATQVAHVVKQHFADGVLYANAATSDPLDILASWARAYGYDFSGLADVQSRAAAVRGLLAEKKVLIVLDNVLEASKVQPLLPSGACNPVLLTTRDLDVAHALNAQALLLGELSAASSRQLLAQILGEERVQAEEEAAAQIGALLHYLPLAVEIAAQRLKSRPRQQLAQLAERLGDEAQRLGLEISDRAVRASFEVSWQALTAESQRFFALLADFAGRPFTAAALAAVADADLYTTEEQLYALEALSLVKAEGEVYYRQHPLLADFGREKLADAASAYGRMADYYFSFAQENNENFATLEPEWGNINAATQAAHRQGHWRLVLAFTDVLAQAWLRRARYGEARQNYALAQEAAIQLEDEASQAENLLRWGEVCIEQNDYAQAGQLLADSLRLYSHLGQRPGIAGACYFLALIAIEQNHYDEATAKLAACLEIRHQLDDKAGIAAVLLEQARIHYDLDVFEPAKALAEEALALQKQVGDRRRLLPTLRMLAQIALLTQQYERALDYCQRAHELSEALHDEGELAATLYALTCTYRYQQNFAQAHLTADEGMSLIRRLGLRKYEGMLLYQFGHIHRANGHLQQARTCTLQSIDILRTLHDDLNCAYSLVLLGDLYASLDQVGESTAAWQAALSIGQAFNHPWLLDQLEQRLR